MQETQQSSIQASGSEPLDEPGLCLLSLDGGGVRGLSTLIILKRLMERTNAERKEHGLDQVKPCELFDLIGGTSTGGLIAIMLGRLEMTVDECITGYTSMFEKIFEKRKHRLPVSLRRNFGNIQERFDSDILRRSIEEIVERQGSYETERFSTGGHKPCRVFVCATASETTTTVPIRSYDLVDESNDDAATIVEAALATSAATTFFKQVTIGARRYVDGALGSNNPVEYVWSEAQSIWSPDDGQLEPKVKCFVSIGTGNPGLAPVRDDARGFISETLKGIATETERTADKAERLHRGLLDKKRYFRYNVQQGLQGVGLEEFRKQPEIEATTHHYLASQTQKFSLRDCARNLGMKRGPMPDDLQQGMTAYYGEVKTSKEIQSTPKVHFLCPPLRSEAFTGRKWYMSRLRELMSQSEKHTRVALYGLGGIGKTRIALQYAYETKASQERSVFWVHTATAERMEKSYLDIAQAVGIVGWDTQNSIAARLRLVQTWFESVASARWLLVLDNADDVNLLYGGPDNPTCLADFFPRSENGAILLTTRNKKVAVKFRPLKSGILEIGPLTTDESVRLLETKINEDHDAIIGDDHQAQRDDYQGERDEKYQESYAGLASILENVPLALVQAAAFILSESISVSEYLALYKQSDASRVQLLSENFEDDVRDSDIKNPVAATFAISFEHIAQSDRLAAEILGLMSMLDPQAIPASLISSGDDSVSLIKALGTLQAFSLINKASRLEQSNQFFDLHRLVRLAMHNWLSMTGGLEKQIASAISNVVERFPSTCHEDRETCGVYLPHALAVLSLDHWRLSTETQILKAALQNKIFEYLIYKGEYALAERMSQRSLETRGKLLGKEHLDTLNSGDNLAQAFTRQGKHKEAEDVDRGVLESRERILGPDHPDTLESMTGLAYDLIYLGKHNQAEEIHREVLKRRQRVLGEEDPATLLSMNNLAVSMVGSGNYEEAEEIYRRTLVLQERVLGEEHPDTIMTMSNLASCLSKEGKYKEAEEIRLRSLEAHKNTLGNEHPLTLLVMHLLAELLALLGQEGEAETIYRRTLAIRDKVLGTQHQDTLRTATELLSLLDDQGRTEEAKDLRNKYRVS